MYWSSGHFMTVIHTINMNPKIKKNLPILFQIFHCMLISVSWYNNNDTFFDFGILACTIF